MSLLGRVVSIASHSCFVLLANSTTIEFPIRGPDICSGFNSSL